MADEVLRALLDEIAENTAISSATLDTQAIVSRLDTLIERLQSPEVPVEPLNLDELKTVLKPVTAQEIANALAPYFAAIQNQDKTVEMLSAVRDAVEKVRYPDQGKGYVQTAIKINNKSTDPVQVGGDALDDIKRGISDYESRLDYGARTDDQPVYIGRAAANTATSATEWTIERITYDGTDRPTRKEVLSGSWDGRASL